MRSERLQRLTYLISDFLMLNIGWLGFNIARYFFLPATSQQTLYEWLQFPPILWGQALMPLVVMAIYWLSGYYNRVYFKSRVSELGNTAIVSGFSTLLIYFIILIDDGIQERMHNYELLMLLFAFLFIPVYIARLSITHSVVRKLHRGQIVFNVLIIGATHGSIELARRLDSFLNRMGMKVVGYVDTDNHADRHSEFDRPVYNLSELPEIAQSLKVNSLIIQPNRNGMKSTIDTINSLYPLGLGMYVPADIYHLISSQGRMTSVVGEPLINISSAQISPSTANIKRVVDVAGSALALLLLSPVLMLTALAVKLDSPGPIFYRQERIGYRKRPFKIIKFRTMRPDAESNGPALSSVDDPRITRIGHFLRKYRFDELPQFWNVLVGDMSIVGPRPERAFYINQLVARVPYYSIIHQVRPGITSLGMVKYGYATNIDQMVQRLRYDLLYIDNISLGTDLKIMIHTIITIVTGRGV